MENRAVRISHFTVEKLFGLFGHTIDFKLRERITIMHAPNGYGKTAILKLINGFFGGSLLIFREIEFQKVVFGFDDGSRITITQQDLDKTATERGQYAYSMDYRKRGEHEEWKPWDRSDTAIVTQHIVPRQILERYLPFLDRVGSRQWRDLRTGEIILYEEVLDRYSDELPARMRGPGPVPPWLDAIRKSLHCQLIETQRLMRVQTPTERPYRRDEPVLTPAVKDCSNDLLTSVGELLKEAATVSQTLERTFPNRLLLRLQEHGAPPEEAALRERLNELERLRARLTKTGLLDSSADSTDIPQEEFDPPTRRVLAEYVEDSEKKLRVYERVLERIELFTDIINGRFQFKQFSFDRRAGFIFTDVLGRAITPDLLSSGEQHEIVLIYDLLFKTQENSLILIDEPEISLHIAWQKRFLDDLRRIIQLTPLDIVLSTHSPQLIGSNLDLTVPLKGPEKYV
jgi:predicted ATP-binding protein involved in virulence